MSISIAMVALGKNAKIGAQAIQREWTKNWPTTPAPIDPEKKDGTLVFRVGDADVIYGLMPAPIPWSDLEGPCSASWLWPDAASEMRTHEKHIIVTVSSESDAIDRLKILTQATAALVGSCEASVGVFWCDARLVISPKVFCDFAVTLLPDGLPLYVWVDFRIGTQDDKTVGFTNGLSALGHMELETLNSPEPPGELRERFFGLAGYLIENGPVIKDGNTIGEDGNERIKIVYTDSAFGHDSQVMRLEYETSSSDTASSKMTAYGYIHLAVTILVTITCAGWMYSLLGGWISSVFLRLILLLIPTLVSGFVLLVVSDRVLQALFGLEAFEDVDSESGD